MLADLAQKEGAAILRAEQTHKTSCTVEPVASSQPVAAGAEEELSFKHQEVCRPAGEQQRPDQHGITEQHKGQQLLQHLQEVNGEGVGHGSPWHCGR